MRFSWKFARRVMLSLLIFFCSFMIPGHAAAAEAIYGGSCGEKAVWTLDDTGTLTVSGSGAMDRFAFSNTPWQKVSNEIKVVVVRSGITDVGDFAFANCVNLERVVLEDGILKVGNAVFQNCVDLRSVTLPDSLTDLGNYTFENCGKLSEINIPEGVNSIGSFVFQSCRELSDVIFGSEIRSIGDGAFLDCTGLEKIALPRRLKQIGNEAFSGCGSLESIAMPDGLENIGNYAFSGCSSLMGISIPDSVHSVGSHAFFNCQKLRSAELSENLRIVSKMMFFNCAALKDIVIPESVELLDNGAFSYCTNLKYISFYGDLPIIEGNVFTDITADCYYPADNSTWQEMTGYGGKLTWKSFIANADKLSIQRLGRGAYGCGDQFAASIIQATLTCSDGSELILGADQYIVENWDSSTPGTRTVTFRYGALVAQCAFTFHERVRITVDKSQYPQSEHDYAVLTDETVDFTYPGAEMLILTFSDETLLGSGDELYLYDGAGSLLMSFIENEASGLVVYTPGDRCSIRLYSDAGDTDYGYSFASIEALTLVHEKVQDAPMDATCTSDGLTAGVHCSSCDAVLVEQTVIPALGHNWGQWEETKQASEFLNGEQRRSCTVCAKEEIKFIPALNPINPFKDVKSDQFENAILWAFYNGITKGTSDTEFSPEAPCTRKQIVTFLWRASGSPEPVSMENPFHDVKKDQFEKAILWAFCEGITRGTSDTEFSPEAPCTRKQIVTFLWRSSGSPEPESMENPFRDVKSDRFEKAILWAYCKGITKGTSDTEFSPEATCTRKQIVTFLYRNLNS